MAAAASSLPRLAEWADKRSKTFEVVAQKRDADSPLADRALELVRRFIVERGLILYGGQAIDFALRLKGSQIYPEHQTPDYDCFSPQSVDDAYELADRLVAAGFPHVGAIPAIHAQTMRVATNFTYVADVSYAPQAVFDSLPTVSYAGMRVLHPDYQRTDMHLAFCFPFNNPPREDIFHRYRKDLERFRLLQELYPVTTGEALAAPPEEFFGAAEPQAVTVEVDLSRVAVHGFAGYALIRNAFEELETAARDGGVSARVLAAARALVNRGPPPLEIRVTAAAGGRRSVVSFAPPAASARLALATPWPNEVVAEIAGHTQGEVQWFAPYMDSRPQMARVTGSGASVDVFSTHNRLLAVFRVVARGGAEVTVATPQYILLNLLYEAHAASAALRDLYVRYYAAALDLIEAGDLLIAALRAEGGGPAVADCVYRGFVESSPFGLPVQTIGDANLDSSYLIRLAQSAQRVRDRPSGVDPADLPDLASVPARYYPGGRHTPGEHPPFNYEASAAFQRNGQPIPAPKAQRQTAAGEPAPTSCERLEAV